jgi:hypothetical protein
MARINSLRNSHRALAQLILALIWCTLPVQAQLATDKAVSLTGGDFFRTTVFSPTMFPTESFSVEFWFKPASAGVLVSEVDTVDTNLWDVALAEILSDGSLRAGAPGVPAIEVAKIEFNTWHHLVVTYDDATDTMNAYLDGAASGSSIGNKITGHENGREYVLCFGRGGPKNLGPGSYLVGLFDEVRVWNIAIDAARVAATWNRTVTTDAAGLWAIWHLDKTSASDPAVTPDARTTPPSDPALHVPEFQAMPLVLSTSPLSSIIAV